MQEDCEMRMEKKGHATMAKPTMIRGLDAHLPDDAAPGY
jgi:hypothetical protein